MSLAVKFAHLLSLFSGGSKLTPEAADGDDLPNYLDELATRRAQFVKPAVDAGGTTAQAEVPFSSVDVYSQTVTAAEFTPAAALTSNDTHYASLEVHRRNAAGTDLGIVASVTTKTASGGGSGDWTAFVAVPLALSTTVGLEILAGECLTVLISKSDGTGVAVPAGVLTVTLK